MAKVSKEHPWISDRDFQGASPRTATIRQILFEPKDRVLLMELDPGTLRQMSIWGDNWNALVEGYGDETNSWIGKRVQISQQQDVATGKTRRSLRIF